MSDIDYLVLARIGLTNPDHRPDGSGLDDGVPLPRAYVNGRKRDEAIRRRRAGETLRAIAADLGVSHETVNVWTAGVQGVRRRAPSDRSPA